MEKHYEHNQDLHMLFVDFKQAFDSIDRYKFYQVMEDMKIPYKLITMVKMTMKNTTARVKVTITYLLTYSLHGAESFLRS